MASEETGAWPRDGSWLGGSKKSGGVACGDGGRGLRVRGEGAWFLGGVASKETGAWPRDWNEGVGNKWGAWLVGMGAWPLGER